MGIKDNTIWRWVQSQLIEPVSETWNRFQRDDGSLMAAAVSYYAGLSLMPLLIVLVSGVGLFLETTQLGKDAQEQVLTAVEREGSPLLRQQLERVFSHVREGTQFGFLGLAGLLFGAIAIFAQFERAFDRIWNVPPPMDVGLLKSLRFLLMQRFRAFLMLLSVGVLILLVFLAGMTLTTVEQLAAQWVPMPSLLMRLLDWSASLALNTLAFTLLYRLLPKVQIRWREALIGAVVVAVGWEIGRHILSNVLIGTRYTSAYGAIGSFLAVLLWLYYASHLLFLGAELIQVICDHCNLRKPEET